MLEQQQIQCAFNELVNREDVSELLGIRDKSLRYLLYARKINENYTTFFVQKKNGQQREINAPCPELKAIQKKLCDILNIVYIPKYCTYGFVVGKSILGNAERHTGRRCVLNIDIKDFFNKINFGRVKGTLTHKPYEIGEEAATVIAQICCYNKVLPQGAPTSPVLTNMVCRPLDNKLMQLATKYGLMYTRYADDITFSTYKTNFPDEIARIENDTVVLGEDLLKIIRNNKFELNETKTKLYVRRKRQEVTGLVVNKFANVKREYIKNIRAILHCCLKKGVYNSAKIYIEKGYCKNSEIREMSKKPEKQREVEEWFSNVIKGKLTFLRDIRGCDDYTFLKYAMQYNKLFDQDYFDTSRITPLIQKIKNNVFVLKAFQSEDYGSGTGFFMDNSTFITCNHVTEDNDFYSILSVSGTNVGCVGNTLNLVKKDLNLDYAVYNHRTRNQTFVLNTEYEIKHGVTVFIAGYPQYMPSNSPTLITAKVIEFTTCQGGPLVTIDKKLLHGISGGIVLNKNHEVIGMVKAGTGVEATDTFKHGFTPIKDIITHLNDTSL